RRRRAASAPVVSHRRARPNHRDRVLAQQRPTARAPPLLPPAHGNTLSTQAMMQDVARVIATLEDDATPDAAAQVIALATTYFETTRRGEGPVSSGRPPNEVAARFDEPMPEDGTDLATIVARIDREML